MQSKLTERFIECMNLVKKNNSIPSTRQLASTINVHPQCLSDISTGKRSFNTDIMRKFADVYPVDCNYIMTGKGQPMFDLNPQPATNADGIIAVVTDESGNERIVHVPYAAHAGYVDQFLDPVYLKDLPTFSLPDTRFSSGTHRCFEVAGDSMEPSLFTNEKVVCSFIEPENWKGNIRNNYVYVLVTETGIIIKRVLNNIKSQNEILIKSDNTFYDAYAMPVSELKEVWQVTYKISPFMPSPSNIRNALHKEVDILRTTINEQSKMIQSLNSTIEKLLKQNRQNRHVSSRY